jgi:hypothetical protein
MEFIAKIFIVALIYYLITSAVSFFRKKIEESVINECRRKQQAAESEAKKESDGQKPSA